MLPVSVSGQAWRAGGCHCGAVRFEALLPDAVDAEDCNCSICAKTAYLHIIVPESRFRLICGGDALVSYSFQTGTARHLFCRKCGIKSFYRPRSNPDGWSVNGRCLDDPSGVTFTVNAFDGRHWEDHGPKLAHLSKEVS